MALAFNQRGVWLTDGDGARVQNVSHGPIPIQSALVPILMYHHVKPIDSKLQNDPAGRELTVPPAEFEGQMRYLIERGFKAISMAELALLLQGRAQLQPRSVIFTFDDGYEDNYLYAFQILQRYGLSGTFFIVTGLVGLDGYMTWSQLSRMLASGMEIGSHLTTHLDLAKLSAIQRDRELRGSKQILEQKMGVSVRALSYPSGSYNSDVVASARKAGYEIAVTTRYGAIIDGSRPMELPRIRVSGHETSASFKAKIEQYFPASDVVSR